MTSFKKTALSLAVASTLAIAGCGGGGSDSAGGGSSGGNGSTTPSVQAQTVAGAAVKGILRSASVTAYDLDQASADVGSTTTDQNGEYSIDLKDSYSGGPLKIVVIATNNTTMVCDAVVSCNGIAQGQEFKVPQNFSLSAITANTKDQKSISAPITAWTTIAAKRAEKLISEGKSAAGAAGIANASISLAAGFDIERTQAKSITSRDIEAASSEQRKAALMNAVIAEAVFKPSSAGGNVDFVAKIAELASAFEDGVFGSTDAGSPENVLKKTLAAAADSVAKDSKLQRKFEIEVKDVAKRQLKFAESEPLAVKDQVSQDENDYTGDLGQNIASFKNFVADVRTWARAIESLDSDALAAAVQVDQETVKNIFKATTEGQFEFAGLVVDSAFNFLADNPAEASTLINNGGSQEIDVLTETGRKVGQVTVDLTNVQGDIQIRLAGSAVDPEGSALAPVDLTLSTNIPVDVVANPNEAGSLDLIVMKLATQSTIRVSGSIGESLITLKDTSLDLTLSRDWIASSSSGLFEDNDLETQFNKRFATARFLGGVVVVSPEGDRFDGDVDVELTRLNDAGAGRNVALNSTRVSLKGFSINGLFGSADGSMQFEASAALNVRNADQFDVVAWANYSRQVRQVTVEVAAVDVAGLKPEGEDPVIGLVSVHRYYDSLQQIGGMDSWARLLFATPGASAENGYELSYVQTQDVIETLKGQLSTQYKNGFLIISNENGVDVERRVAAEALLTGSEVGFYSAEWGSSYSNAVDTNLPDGSVYIELDGAREFVGSVNGYGNSERSFNLTLSAIQAEELESTLNLGSFLVENAQVSGLNIYSYYEGTFARIGYSVPVSRESFDQCVENPIGVLQSYNGYVETGLSDIDAALDCAFATLEYRYVEDVGVDATVLAQLELKGTQQLKVGLHADLREHVTANLNQVEFIYGESVVNEPAQFELAAKFPDLETADSFLEGSIFLSARVKIPELPEANVDLMLDRSKQKGGEVEANVNWNGGNYSANVKSDNFEELQGTDVITATFFNAEGYRLTLAGSFDENGKLSNLTGDAFVKDTDIGDVTLRGNIPIISYPNGTETEFESLF